MGVPASCRSVLAGSRKEVGCCQIRRQGNKKKGKRMGKERTSKADINEENF